MLGITFALARAGVDVQGAPIVTPPDTPAADTVPRVHWRRVARAAVAVHCGLLQCQRHLVELREIHVRQEFPEGHEGVSEGAAPFVDIAALQPCIQSLSRNARLTDLALPPRVSSDGHAR